MINNSPIIVTESLTKRFGEITSCKSINSVCPERRGVWVVGAQWGWKNNHGQDVGCAADPFWGNSPGGGI